MADAPPHYAFDYERVRPWAWEAADRSREIVEPVPGGYRHYYFQPWADAPYLVRDPSYTYAFAGPTLVTVVDIQGRPLPPDSGYAQALYAASGATAGSPSGSSTRSAARTAYAPCNRAFRTPASITSAAA